MLNLLITLLISFFLSGCVSIPLNKDGEVQVGKNTSIGMEDLGIGKIKNKF